MSSRMGRHRGVVLLAGLFLLPALPLGLARASQPAPFAAPGTPELGPLIAGTSSYVDGTYVWTDYAYDDRGPDSDGIKGGDATYPPDAAPGNAADLIQLQVGLTSERAVTVTAVLNSLVRADLPVVGVGFDTDSDPSTGAASVPGGSWQALGPLGLEAFLVAAADGGRFLVHDAVNGTWSAAGDALPVTVDVDDNVVGATVPSSLLDPGSSAWRAVGVLGTTVAGASWVDGSAPVYDLAFLRAEDPFTESAYAVVDAAHQVSGQAQGKGSGTREWQDHRQADVLAGKMDSTQAVAVIDFAKVSSGVTELATVDPATSRFETFLYHSRVRLGEGVVPAPRQYRGVYQPYLVRLPPPSLAAPGLVVFLHGGSGNHLQSANYFAPSFTEFISPGHFDPPAAVIFPLGRDEDWLPAPSEQDFLDAVDDALERLGLDPNRVVVSGISAGGVGTLRYGQLYPDRFSGVYALAGGIPPGLLQNMANLPVRMTNGLADPALGTGNTVLTAPVLDQLGIVDYRAWLANLRSHVPIPALGDCVLRELVTHPRQIDPARVVFTADPRLDVVDPDLNIVLRHDRAYWASGIRVRDPSPGGVSVPAIGQYVDVGGEPKATIDATSLARADRVRQGQPTRTAHENATHGEDFCGPNPAVQTGDSWEESALRLETVPTDALSNGMELKLTNVAAATLDVTRMSLSTTAPLEIRVQGDGPSALSLLGPWPGAVSVIRDGVLVDTIIPEAGAVVLSGDFSGAHHYQLIPA